MIRYEDFIALGLSRQPPLREVAADDAWLAFRDYEHVHGYDASATTFYKEHLETSPHWFVQPQGEHTDEPEWLFNIDAQARAYKAEPEIVRIGLADRGLRIGQILKRPQSNGKIEDSTNPWSDKFKGDAAARQARVVSIIKGLGAGTASKLAAAQNKTLTGEPLRK